MTIEGDNLNFERYMEDFMKKSTVKWKRCKQCGNWVSLTKERVPCPLCPPQRKKERAVDEDEEVFDPITKAYVPKGLF